MPRATFETVLQRPEGEATTTFIEIPLDVRAVFGRARPPVTVTMNGYTYRSTVAVYGTGSSSRSTRRTEPGPASTPVTG